MADLDIRSTTIEKGFDLLKGFLERAFGPSIDELALQMQDNVKFRRARNQLKRLQKAKEKSEAKGIDIKQLNLKVLFPLLEGMALEEDENLGEMWSSLMVNYIDVSKNLTVVVYPWVLSQLSSEEVTVLLHLKI